MLNKNKKLFLDGKKTCINVPINTNPIKIVAEIIEKITDKFMFTYGVMPSIESILFLSSRMSNDVLEIPVDMLNEDSKLFGFMKSLNLPTFTIKMSNVYTYTPVKDAVGVPTFVIIGDLNTIHNSVLYPLLDYFASSYKYLFGDEQVSGVELSEYYNRYLTNAEYHLSLPYSTYRLSEHKKINSLLTKLRDKRNMNMSLISSGREVMKTQGEVDIDLVHDRLEEGWTVIVPRRLFTTINSMLINNFVDENALLLEQNTVLFSKYPFTWKDVDNVNHFVPAGSKVIINLTLDEETIESNESRKIVFKTVTFITPTETTTVNHVPIDYSGFLLNFDVESHITLLDEMTSITNNDPIVFNPTVLSLTPFRLYTHIEQKYMNIDKLLVYIETFDVNVCKYSPRSTWFEQVSQAKEFIDIVYDTEFEL